MTNSVQCSDIKFAQYSNFDDSVTSQGGSARSSGTVQDKEEYIMPQNEMQNETFTKLTLFDVSGKEINANLCKGFAYWDIVEGDVIAI